MSRLNLSTCPICQAQDSLSRETMDRAGQTFTWYQCQACGSVLLWQDDDLWTYQKIGREDQTHLLRQPLTVAELQALAGVPDEAHEASEPPAMAFPPEEPDEPLVASVPSVEAFPAEEPDEPYGAPGFPVMAFPAEEPDESYEAPAMAFLAEEADEPYETPAPPATAFPTEEPDEPYEAPVPDRERRGPSRWLLLALAVIVLLFVCAVVALLVANQLGY
jgi:hypothetical protein